MTVLWRDAATAAGLENLSNLAWSVEAVEEVGVCVHWTDDVE